MSETTPASDGPDAAAEASELDGLAFEQALEQVEAIIGRIEDGELGLEEQIAQYQRGSRLLLRCRAILEQCEQRVEQIDTDLARMGDGSPEDDG